MARRKRLIEVRVRLYHDRDADLIGWIEQYDDRPFGAKSQAIKSALRQAIDGETLDKSPAGTGLGLAVLRQIVESAVDSALARWNGIGAHVKSEESDEDQEIQTLLKSLGRNLILDED